MLKNMKNTTYKNNMKIYLTAIMMLLHGDIALANEIDDIPAIDCMMEPNVLVDLSSSVAGVLDTLTVDKSDEVKKGEVIATLKSDIEQVSVRSSRERLKLSAAEYKRAAELYREKAITKSEKEQSDNDKKLAELELKHAKTNLNLRRIKSPINGVVVKRYANPGEFVETKPILQLAQLDPLRIEVVSPVANYGKIVKGMRANIVPEFGEYDGLVAEVVVVDKVVDAASGTFSIRLELDNKSHAIPGGLRCRAKFMPMEAPIQHAKLDKNIEKQHETKVKKKNEIKFEKKAEKKESKIMANKSVEKSLSQKLSNQSLVSQNLSSQESTSKKPKQKEIPTVSVKSVQEKICKRIGPYKNQKVLAKIFLPISTVVEQVELNMISKSEVTYQVVSDRFRSKSEAESIKHEMQSAGIRDTAFLAVTNKQQLALGVYGSKKSAIQRMNAVQTKGFGAEVSKRQKQKNMIFAEIKYSPSSARLIAKHIKPRQQATCTAIKVASSNNL